MNRSPKLDLRAHYSASSTTSDDSRYRAQGASYLGFEVARVVRLCDQGQTASPHEASKTSRIHPTPGIYVDETQAALQAISSQLLQPSTSSASSSGLLSSPRADPKQPDRHDAIDQEPSRSESLRSANSSHLKTPVIHRHPKRRRLHNPDQVIGAADLHETSSASRIIQQSSPAQAVIGEQQDTNNGSTSELPTSYSLSELEHPSARLEQHSVHRSISDPGPSSPLARRRDLADSSSAEYGHQSVSSHQAIPQSSAEQQMLPSNSMIKDKLRLKQPVMLSASPVAPRIIQGPSPDVTVNTFTTHITERLQLLAQNPKLQGPYNALIMARSVSSLERGHWLFSTAAWPTSLQLSFWKFLGDFICSGAAGWGIFCSWSDRSEEGKDIIKAFCWGEIIKHTYLLLYVASRSKIRKLEARWIDAAGETVVRVTV